jgi:hypothetical protein
VDVVELLFVEPVILGVVYFEAAVGWNTTSISGIFSRGEEMGRGRRTD